jgi:hypothetical protein
VHGLQARRHAVQDVDHLLDGERAAIDQPFERVALHQLHDQDGLGPRAGVEGDEARDVGVPGQGQKRARFLAEELHELLFRQRVRGGAGVCGHLEREDLGAFLVALFRAAGNEHRAAAARANGAHDEKAADDAAGRQPRGQVQLALALGDVGDLARRSRLARQAPHPHEHARHHLGEKRRQILAHGLGRGGGGGAHALVALLQGALDPRLQAGARRAWTTRENSFRASRSGAWPRRTGARRR